ncbi:MAG: hypothetical protein IIB10_12935 [Chloroflexi bacterium]|nr:hypothetical protein [Chloroflexota bacterium]
MEETSGRLAVIQEVYRKIQKSRRRSRREDLSALDTESDRELHELSQILSSSVPLLLMASGTKWAAFAATSKVLPLAATPIFRKIWNVLIDAEGYLSQDKLAEKASTSKSQIKPALDFFKKEEMLSTPLNKAGKVTRIEIVRVWKGLRYPD